MAEAIDREILPLVEAMNRVPFLETVSSCAGHPDERISGPQIAVANVVFEVKDEPRNLIPWYRLMERILLSRRDAKVSHDFGCTFDRRFSLGEGDALGWEWVLKVEGCGRGTAECRAALDEGISFLAEIFRDQAAPGTGPSDS